MPNPFNTLRAHFLERLAMNSFVVSDFPKAARLLEKIARLCPERQGVHYNLGLVQMAMKDYDQAESSLREELKCQPGGEKIFRALADLAFLRGERIKAADYYRRVAAKAAAEKERALVKRRILLCSDPQHFTRAMEAARLFEGGCEKMQAGEYPEAVQAFKEAMEGDPTHFLACNNLGVIAMNVERDFPKALGFFRQADALIDHPLVKANLKKLAQHTEQEHRA